MPTQASPYDLVSDIRAKAERLRMQEVRQGIRGSIAARSITADKIVIGTITHTEIADGTLLAQNIQAGTITGDRIAADTITASQIAADAVTANEIAGGTITANQIAADTITGGNIQNGSISAAEINVATLSAITANLGTVTAGTISLGAITMDTTGIKANGDGASYRFFTGDGSTRTAAARCNLPTAGGQSVQVELDAYTGFAADNRTSSAIRVRDGSSDAELAYIRAFGSGSLSSSAAITNSSDRRLKKRICDVKDPLGAVLSLRPRTFTRKLGNLTEAGFVAQELETVLPDLVSEHDHDGKPAKGIAYDGIHAYTVGAIQELARRVEKLEAG